MRTRLGLAVALPLLVLVSMTACAPRHATIDDCVKLTISFFDDFDRNEDLGNVTAGCAQHMANTEQEVFDEIYLPK